MFLNYFPTCILSESVPKFVKILWLNSDSDPYSLFLHRMGIEFESVNVSKSDNVFKPLDLPISLNAEINT